jgi:hypothetical protein
MTQHTSDTRRVDHTGLKVGMALTIALLLAGFVFNNPILVAFVAAAQLFAAFDSPYAPYRLIYKRLILPTGFLQPNVIVDNPEPHRFALLLGGIFNTLSVITYLSGAQTVAWVLAWIVIALANLNFWLEICVGCLMYYQLNRLGVPGFKVSPIEGGKG